LDAAAECCSNGDEMERGVRAQGLAQGRERLMAGLKRCGVPGAVIDALLSRHTLVRYPKGAALFARGAPADVVFAILGGVVKVYCGHRPQGRILVALASPGDLAGYADFCNPAGDRSQMFEAEALTATTVAIITRDHILRVMRGLEAPALLTVTEAINSLWASALHRCVRFLAMSLRERLEAVLAEIEQRFGVPDARGVMLTAELGHQGFAEMIGASRPMVSKLMTELADQGRIARQGRHYIVTRSFVGAKTLSGAGKPAEEQPPKDQPAAAGRSRTLRGPRRTAA
jgi:CRP/FNR family transcriptional regulator, cyclic AMP receptor protein